MSRAPRRLSSCRRLLAAAVGTLCLTALVPAQPALASFGVRVDLRVLVVTDLSSNVEALRTQLATEGVPTTVVSLADANRPALTAGFLSDTLWTGPRARFQAVVLPNAAPAALTAQELTALADYERRFGIRQVEAYVYPNAAVGLTTPTAGGPLDGKTVTVTPAGTAGPFRYLRGSFPVDDVDPAVGETWGYTSTAGPDFTPLLTVDGAPLLGVHSAGGRQRMPITASFNADQTWFRLLAHGVITWMTKGVHLGLSRNYFAVQSDDLLLPDARWSTAGNCTPGADCAEGVAPTDDIRMTAEDVDALVAWQAANDFTIDQAFNAAGSVQAIAEKGSDPLTAAVLKHKASLVMLNHTYSHQNLGCLQDTSVRPARCRTDAAGNVLYQSRATIAAEIRQNLDWAARNGIALRAGDLVTGEHSGLRVAPQQPADNPNLAGALADTGITSIASDASRESTQRAVGPARTVMRHPMNVFYNVATAAEEVDEYNWIYASAADGGSGLCTRLGLRCLDRPMTGPADYRSRIVPLETRIALGHVLSNDPRPHFLHQSNLAEERIAYPLLESVLSTYRSWLAPNAPIVNLRLGGQRSVLELAGAWSREAAARRVTGFTLGGRLYVTSTAAAAVPVTVPAGGTFGQAYAGERSTWVGLRAGETLQLPLS